MRRKREYSTLLSSLLVFSSFWSSSFLRDVLSSAFLLLLPSSYSTHPPPSSSKTVKKLSSSTMIFTILVVMMSFPSSSLGKCHIDKCSCSTDNLKVNCTKAGLKSVPITFYPRLQEYTIRENDLSDLGVSRPFEAYTLLVYLDLSLNRLRDIPAHTFQNQKQLKVLNLSGNRISSLSSESFKGLQSLEKLMLTNNSLSTISPSIFTHLTSLDELYLDHNQISNTYEDSFYGLTSLKFLSLRDNRLGFDLNPYTEPYALLATIPSARLAYSESRPVKLLAIQGLKSSILPNLAILDLGKNHFSGIISNSSPFALDESSPETSSWTKLKELNLDGCFIEFIEGSAFSGLESLSILRIHDNSLTEAQCNEPITVSGKNILDLEAVNVSCTKESTMTPFVIVGSIIAGVSLCVVLVIVLHFRSRLVNCIRFRKNRMKRRHSDFPHHHPAFLPASIAVSSKFIPSSVPSHTIQSNNNRKVYSFDPPSLSTIGNHRHPYENLGSLRNTRQRPEFVYVQHNKTPEALRRNGNMFGGGNARNISTLCNGFSQRAGDGGGGYFDPIYRPRHGLNTINDLNNPYEVVPIIPPPLTTLPYSSASSSSSSSLRTWNMSHEQRLLNDRHQVPPHQQQLLHPLDPEDPMFNFYEEADFPSHPQQTPHRHSTPSTEL